MKAQTKYALDVLAKGYVALAVAYSLYLWFSGPFSGPRSWRIVFAVVAFGVCVWLPERASDNPYVVPLLKVFGVIGTTVMLLVLHQQGA